MALKKISKHIRIIVLLTLFLCLNNYGVSAQYLYEFGFGGGISGYTGEVSNNPFSQPSYALGGFFRSNLNSRFALTLGLEYGKVKGGTDDVSETYPPTIPTGYDFTTQIINAEMLMEINFFPYPFQKTVRNSSNITPYYFMGVGLVSSKPLNGAVGTDGGNPISIPLGVGLRWSVSKQLGVQVRFKGSKLFEDDLDSDKLDDPFEFGDSGFHRKDWLYTTTFMLTYSFGEDLWDCNCPDKGRKKHRR